MGARGGIDDGDWGSKNVSQWRNIGWQFGGREGGLLYLKSEKIIYRNCQIFVQDNFGFPKMIFSFSKKKHFHLKHLKSFSLDSLLSEHVFKQADPI